MSADDNVQRICIQREFHQYQKHTEFSCHECGTPFTYGVRVCLDERCESPLTIAGLEAQCTTCTNLDRSIDLRTRLATEKECARTQVVLSRKPAAYKERLRRAKISTLRTVARTDYGIRGSKLPTQQERLADLEAAAGSVASLEQSTRTWTLEECIAERSAKGSFPIDTFVSQKMRKGTLNAPALLNRKTRISERGFSGHIEQYDTDYDYQSQCESIGIGTYFSFHFKSLVHGDTEERQYFFDEIDHQAEAEAAREKHLGKLGKKADPDDDRRQDQEQADIAVGQKRKAREVELAALSASQPSSSSSHQVVEPIRGGKPSIKGQSPMDAVLRANQSDWAYDGTWLHGDHRRYPQKRKSEGKGKPGGGKRHKGGQGK